MTARWLSYVAAVVAATTTPSGARADETKQSLPTESAEAEWLRPGFRVQLGVTGGHLAGLDGAPSGHLIGPVLRAGLRLDKDWSLLTSFQYTLASKDGELSGLRFVGALEPTWHATGPRADRLPRRHGDGGGPLRLSGRHPEPGQQRRLAAVLGLPVAPRWRQPAQRVDRVRFRRARHLEDRRSRRGPGRSESAPSNRR